MQKTTLLSLSSVLASVLLLSACIDTTGISPESTRPSKGSPNGIVVVQEFADLQCPSCKAAHTQINEKLLEKYGSKIRFEFRHFPLRSLHRFAQNLAEAAECSADQGKFWEFVDIAFANQESVSKQAIQDWAVQLGLDMDLFNRCTRSHIKKATIESDYQVGKAGGVTGTPTYFIDGQKVETDLTKMGQAIEAAEASTIQKL